MDYTTATPARACDTASWDDLKDVNKELISRFVRENMLERLRRTRLLKYVYSGLIDEEDRVALLQGINGWNTADPGEQRRQAIERQFRDVFDSDAV